ncbi:4247_t:CDS:2 [Acaulospora colombiana]|uniref:4247_t:CDS:1 n=1 Tax=Acaulospora colombiana TaxID=27376 RepID=A0ACA9P6H5_9GLOM|nr:4247_t:CDS:2 [Acaulospora colombiana]
MSTSATSRYSSLDENLNLNENDSIIPLRQNIDGQRRVFKKGRVEYFWSVPCETWSIQHFKSWSADNFDYIERNEEYTIFYNTLYIFRDDSVTSQGILEVVKNILRKKKVSGKKIRKPLSDTSNQQEVEEVLEPFESDLSAFPGPVVGKRSIDNVSDMYVDIPLRNDGSTDILEILKIAICEFDQGTIALGSSRSYKSSNHLCVDSMHFVNVPRESTYDAELHRVLVNWLRKIHGYEITGQWHLEQVGDDGDFHNLYCDLTIKKPDSLHLEALLEFLATASISKLNEHFEQVFKYIKQLHSKEIWIVHFSREDSVVTNPYWPSEKLQEKGLNVVHFWHDREFKNVRMSARFRDVTGKFCEIIDEQILS